MSLKMNPDARLNWERHRQSVTIGQQIDVFWSDMGG